MLSVSIRKICVILFTCLTYPLMLSASESTNRGQGHNSQDLSIYQFANQCFELRSADGGLTLQKKDAQYHFSTLGDTNTEQTAARIYMRPTGLGTYLLFDQNKSYISAKQKILVSQDKLISEMVLDMPEKDYIVTEAEWKLSLHPEGHFKLFNLKSELWLTQNILSDQEDQALALSFYPTKNCASFPEASTNSKGSVIKTHHEDGTLWGFVDAHEHITANHGFGGMIFHGAAFHKLGIEHALADSQKHHGIDGSKDLMSITYKSGSGNITIKQFFSNLFKHLVQDKPDHDTSGYPELTDWTVHRAPTHQSLYYKWIERAYLGGMRVMVEYLESTEVVCEVYKNLFPSNSEAETCNEMVHVDHQLEKMKEMQDYIDAQHGGPDKGWFRLVYSPEEAREVVKAGKLAVILGLEIENPFDCFIDERDEFEVCTDAIVKERLKRYYDKGVRALFPSHKFVNAFSSGDGDTGILELGDYLNTGQWRQYVDCDNLPGPYIGSHSEGKERSLFTRLSGLPGIETLNGLLSDGQTLEDQALPLYSEARTHCQQDGLTPLGFTLIREMMELGMIIDLGHSPKAALNDLIPMLKEANYPAVHTHGGDRGAIEEIRGLSTRGLGDVCRDEQGRSQLMGIFDDIVERTDPDTGLPQRALSYDFNGFAGYARPRFGDLSRCENEQQQPLEYPFTSFAGDVVFEKSKTGNREFDFNTEGLANIGLYPDLIEEARRSGVKDEAINLLFKSAEAYIQIWERAENHSSKTQSPAPAN